jgi:rubrerythrin
MRNSGRRDNRRELGHAFGSMSFIVRSLEKLLQTHEENERELRDKEQTIRPLRRRQGDPPTFRCRVCGLQAPEASYCPECLADTMVRVTT